MHDYFVHGVVGVLDQLKKITERTSMKLVDRKTFLNLPVGTIYYKMISTDECAPTHLCRKGETIRHSDELPCDWNYCSLEFNNFIEQSSLEWIGQRDGCFDDTDMFWVFHRVDVQTLLDEMQPALYL